MERLRFCPNRECELHFKEQEEGSRWYQRWGRYSTGCFGKVQRYKCKICGKSFSDQTYSLDYYVKKAVDYEWIEKILWSSGGGRAIGRALGVSEDVIRNRVQRLSRQALGAGAMMQEGLRGEEDLTADGFESFCGSQYFPGHINLLVGKESQYLYRNDYVTLRRKGRMREAQRKKRESLDAAWKIDPRGIVNSFRVLGEGIVKLFTGTTKPVIRLYTDYHNQYRRGLKEVEDLVRWEKEGRFQHLQISSKQRRTTKNPLFSVNYYDRELRKDLSNFVRESTRFGRNINDLMSRFQVYVLWHNYRKSYRVRSDKRDNRSHAEIAGLNRELIEKHLKNYYKDRCFFTHLVLTKEGILTWFRMWENPFKFGNKYLPRFVCA